MPRDCRFLPKRHASSIRLPRQLRVCGGIAAGTSGEAMRVSRTMIVVLWLGSLLAVGGMTAAVASIPATDGTISACYNTKSGALRVIDTATTQQCEKSEKSVTWDQSGGAEAYRLFRSPYAAVDLPLSQVVRLEQLTLAEGVYQANLSIHLGSREGASATVRCSIGGGNFEPAFYDRDTVSLDANGNATIHLSSLIVWDNVGSVPPVELTCVANGSPSDGRVVVDDYTGSLVRIEKWLG